MDAKQIELIRRIASVVGHELRNPLAVINNSAYFLKTKLGQDGRLDPKVEKHLGIVTSEIQRTDKMIADILAYSRPMEAKLIPVPLAPVVETALAALAVPDKVKLVKKLGKGVSGHGDDKLLGDAARKLLDNAVEALPDGGTITVTVAKEGKHAVIEVADTGAGVKPEILPHLFEPFRTGKPRGLGLGLALVKKIAEAHRGEASGGNDSGGGARFRLAVPAA